MGRFKIEFHLNMAPYGLILMREAVERSERKQRHLDACVTIFALRKQMPPVSPEEKQAARDELRK